MLRYIVTEVTPAVWGSGGIQLFSDREREVTEQEFWESLKQFESRKQEILDYLLKHPDNTVSTGKFTYSIR